MDSVQKIHVRFDPDLMTTVKERAITEILLELCNVELEVEITESEVRELLEIYMEVYKAKPFIGLRELVESDGGVAMFFRMFKEVVVPIRDLVLRRRAALLMYQKFVGASSAIEQTLYTLALRTRIYNLVLFALNYKLAVQRPKAKKVWVQ